MTARTASRSIDGTPISDADRARMAEEEAQSAKMRARAVRAVAGAAHDAADCRLLLEILGLDPALGVGARAGSGGKRGRRRQRAA